MSELAGLIRSRGQIKAKLTRFQAFVMNFEENVGDTVQLQLRTEKIEGLCNEFDAVQAKIELLDESQVSERDTFEDLYFEVVSQAKKLMNQNNSMSGNDSSISSSGQHNMSDVKLPRIDLPHFDGTFGNWLSFYEAFKSIIHENQQISKVQKFYYLKSCLKGPAKQIVESLEVTASNYDISWDLLNNRFHNERLIVHSYVKALFELPLIQKESANALRHLIDSEMKYIRVLKSLKQPTESWDTLLIFLICTKLDVNTKREWEQSIKTNTVPTMQEFEAFLSKKCELLETLNTKEIRPKAQPICPPQRGPTLNNSYVHVSTGSTCPICKELHPIYYCQTFQNSSVQKRYELAKNNKLCLNCLKPNHFSNVCEAKHCRYCNRKHNSLLHLEKHVKQSNNQSTEPSAMAGASTDPKGTENPDNNSQINSSNPNSHKNQVSLMSFKSNSQIILSTAMVTIRDSQGNALSGRVLLDSGSQANFMTNDLANRLCLKRHNTNIPVCGINSTSANIHQFVYCEIKSNCNNFRVNLQFLILEKITDNLPLCNVNEDSIVKSIPAITLADPGFGKSGKVDMLLGASIFWDLLCIGQIKLDKGPTLQKTKLGWIIAGEFMTNANQKIVCNLVTNAALLEQMKNFFTLEDGGNYDKFTTDVVYTVPYFIF